MTEKTCNEIAKDLGAWPNCNLPDCENKATLWMPSGRCFPHSTGISPRWMDNMMKQHGCRPWREHEEWVQDREDRAAKGETFDPLENAQP